MRIRFYVSDYPGDTVGLAAIGTLKSATLGNTTTLSIDRNQEVAHAQFG